MPSLRHLTSIILFALMLTVGVQDEKARPGYSDTPQLPGQSWRVHDKNRPYPKVVRPAQFGAAPSDAQVLFGGDHLKEWQHADGRPAQWTVGAGTFEVNARSGDIQTVDHFGDLQLHIEWRAPEKLSGQGQGRSNSGVFFMGRYEVQILDSFQNPTYADGQAAALYGQYSPEVNGMNAPGEWQSYDIAFDAPRFENGRVLSPARVTVFHNGILVHHGRAMIGATAHRKVATYSAHGATGPIRLQDHGNPVSFRNIWVRRR